ncbi:MAG: endonuclease III [Candidatus Neomarinimicrobiota bacterium]|nr:endonuclease III [Candidatus Neomarinimicrobiota bacterium]
MLKKDKVNFIITKLDEIYPKVSPPLNHHNNYTLLIAVLLSANTTDKSVNNVTPKLFKKADNPQKMAKLKYETVYNIIKPCGLGPFKANAIIELSEILIEKYKGEVPNSFADLESFPGVGHKTASVVMSQAFGVPAFPVDTHVHRLMYRWGLSSGRSVQDTEKQAKRLFPKEKWNKLHLQIIFYGREYCTAKNFNPSNCPITSVVGRRSLFK